MATSKSDGGAAGKGSGGHTGIKPPEVNDNEPPDPEGTDEATKDNDLSTGHSRPGDGGDDNAKR